MQNPDPSLLTASQPEPQEDESRVDAQSFPFLTKLWVKGNTIGNVLALVIALGTLLVFAGKTDGSGVGLAVGSILGVIYGAITWLFLKFYSEFAGMWLNIEESTRITADVLSRMETKDGKIASGKEGFTEAG